VDGGDISKAKSAVKFAGGALKSAVKLRE
jgi:hypothetical protein